MTWFLLSSFNPDHIREKESKVKPRTQEQAIYLSNAIYERIEKKESSFCREALNYSDDLETRTKCGEIGWKEPGSLCTEYQDAACLLEPGEISVPIKSPLGYHIIHLVDKRGNTTNTRHILITFEETVKIKDKEEEVNGDE
jgi:peptidyl-prolyl cis-trans isomerase SurA